MINTILTKIIGTKNERELKRIRPLVQRIGELEPSLRPLTDVQLAAWTAAFKERLAKGEPLDGLLPEAFAVAREAGRRVLNMRHFDVQLIGGIALHRGMIAEMKTGEGKTLVATLAGYLNALEGKGVHVVTVNDYLAKRDAEWMGRIYRFLGLTVGVIQHHLDDQERQVAYRADITYGTNNEFGFDYLRDNMKFDLGSYVQRGHHFAVVDEVDSILIDEARTPLIISGPAEESTDKYYRINAIIPKLKPGARITGDKKAEERAELEKTGDYIVDEKAKTVTLTEQGMLHAERLLGVQNLWDPSNMEVLHHVNQGLRAHTLFQRDVDYVVKDGQVIIVDEFTGRLMPGRRWSDGLHQAVEAKEKVKIERENQTLATITFQNYFRMYKKLAGMTGTAETEAPEFDKIYKLEVLAIPTNRPLIRVENPDVVYRTEREKFEAVVAEIKDLHETGRPVLVGTISIEKSEQLSTLLKKADIKHVVLNAKYHEREAEIVAQAGRYGAVTIATNMASRRRSTPSRPPRKSGRPPPTRPSPRWRRNTAGPSRTRSPRPRIAGPSPSGTSGSWPRSRRTTLRCSRCGPRPRRARPSRNTSTPSATFPARTRRGSRRPSTRRSRTRWTSWPSTPSRRRWTSSPPPPTSRRSSPSSTAASASGWWPWAAFTSWPPSGTKRGASTTSSAAGPAARATPAPRVSTCRCRTTSCGSSAPTASAASC